MPLSTQQLIEARQVLNPGEYASEDALNDFQRGSEKLLEQWKAYLALEYASSFTKAGAEKIFEKAWNDAGGNFFRVEYAYSDYVEFIQGVLAAR